MECQRRGQHTPAAEERLAAFAALCALVVCLCGFAGQKSAYAFTVDGETYPDSLYGYTVTLNKTLTAPPTSICNKWWVLDIETWGAAASPQYNTKANSVYFWGENFQTVTSGNPWFWYVSCAKSTSSAGSLPGIDYFARYGYDGKVPGWWGLQTGVEQVTIKFYDTFKDSSANGYLITNHDFIIWVVNNSDYRTRYEGDQWTTPTVVVNQHSFGWSAPEGNVSSTLTITNTTTAEVCYTDTGTGASEGSYTALTSGVYRFTWEYTLNGLQKTSAWTSEYITVPTVETPIRITSVETQVTSEVTATVLFTAHTTGQVTSVKLQFSQDGGQTWEDYSLGIGDFTQGETSGIWTLELGVNPDELYRVVASNSSQNVSFYVGAPPNASFSFAQHIQNVVEYVSSFISHVGDLFAWLPIELRAFIISIIIIMVVLGLFGWLKS